MFTRARRPSRRRFPFRETRWRLAAASLAASPFIRHGNLCITSSQSVGDSTEVVLRLSVRCLRRAPFGNRLSSADGVNRPTPTVRWKPSFNYTVVWRTQRLNDKRTSGDWTSSSRQYCNAAAAADGGDDDDDDDYAEDPHASRDEAVESSQVWHADVMAADVTMSSVTSTTLRVKKTRHPTRVDNFAKY